MAVYFLSSEYYFVTFYGRYTLLKSADHLLLTDYDQVINVRPAPLLSVVLSCAVFILFALCKHHYRHLLLLIGRTLQHPIWYESTFCCAPCTIVDYGTNGTIVVVNLRRKQHGSALSPVNLYRVDI